MAEFVTLIQQHRGELTTEILAAKNNNPHIRDLQETVSHQ